MSLGTHVFHEWQKGERTRQSLASCSYTQTEGEPWSYSQALRTFLTAGALGPDGGPRERPLKGWPPGLPCQAVDDAGCFPLFQYNCRQFSKPRDCLSSPSSGPHQEGEERWRAFLKGRRQRRPGWEKFLWRPSQPWAVPLLLPPVGGICYFPLHLNWAGWGMSASCSQLCPCASQASSLSSCRWCCAGPSGPIPHH